MDYCKEIDNTMVFLYYELCYEQEAVRHLIEDLKETPEEFEQLIKNIAEKEGISEEEVLQMSDEELMDTIAFDNSVQESVRSLLDQYMRDEYDMWFQYFHDDFEELTGGGAEFFLISGSNINWQGSGFEGAVEYIRNAQELLDMIMIRGEQSIHIKREPGDNTYKIYQSHHDNSPYYAFVCFNEDEFKEYLEYMKEFAEDFSKIVLENFDPDVHKIENFILKALGAGAEFAKEVEILGRVDFRTVDELQSNVEDIVNAFEDSYIDYKQAKKEIKQAYLEFLQKNIK